VQSGSDRVLKLMHRGYTRERFLEIIRKLRAAKPTSGLPATLSSVFPGETEMDFEHTLSLCREVEFDNAFLFKYSQRKDTPAAAMQTNCPRNSSKNVTRDCSNWSTRSANANTNLSFRGRCKS